MSRKMRKIVWITALVIVVLSVGAGIAAAQEDEPGLVIVRVLKDSPAARAGIVRGDILLAVDGQAINSVAELRAILANRQAGDEVEVSLLHGDDERTLTAILGEEDGAFLGVVPFEEAGSPGPALPPMERLPLDVLPLPDQRGAEILEVAQDSPASAAGIEAGDMILAVDGQELDREQDLASVIARYAPGDAIRLQVARGEERLEIEVTLAEHPEREGEAYLGVSYRTVGFLDLEGLFPFEREGFPREKMLPFRTRPDISPGTQPFDRRFRFQMPDSVLQGAIIRAVAEDSPAAAAGLADGDVITAIDGEAITSPRDLVDAIAERQPGDVLTLTIQRDDESEDIEVTLAEHPKRDGAAYLGASIGGFFQIRSMRNIEPSTVPAEPDQTAPQIVPEAIKPLWDLLRPMLPFNLERLGLPKIEELFPFDLKLPAPDGMFEEANVARIRG